MLSKLGPLLLGILFIAVLLTACEIPRNNTVEKDQVLVCQEGAADFTTIQAAIDGVATGSTITVCPGTYNERLRIKRKSLTLRSTEGFAETVIEAASKGSAIDVSGVGAPGVTIEGFSIRGGHNANGSGGGVSCEKSSLALVDNAISNNNAKNGGGLAIQACQVEISGNRIFNNKAANRGGGAFMDGSEGTVEANELYGNTAQEGGGLAALAKGFRPLGYAFSDHTNEEMTVKNNIIRENSASPKESITYDLKHSGGGGIWAGGDTVIIENKVRENKSSVNGGGIYVVNANATIDGNDISGNQAGDDGGGLYINTSAGRITDNLFTENSSLDDAGGLRIYFGLNMEIENNIISKNEAVDASGGVKLSHSKNIFRNNVLEENRADTAGGLELDNEATAVENCTFRSNQARLGAAIHAKAAEQDFMIKNCFFESNIASEYGGALHFEHNAHPVILAGIKARYNQAKKGGFIATNNSRLELSDAVLKGNSADEAGGALFFSGYEAFLKDEAVTIPIDVTTNEEEPKFIKLRRVRMEGNNAATGGALFARENTRIDAANLIIAGNNADESGGGIALMAADGSISNLVLARNGAPKAAGMLLDETTGLKVRNCIITANGDGEGVFGAGSPNITWQYNNVYDNKGGDYGGLTPTADTDGNISQPPFFVNAAAYDYHLKPGSPCLDKGDPEENFNDVDQSRADMGAYGGPDGLWNPSQEAAGYVEMKVGLKTLILISNEG